MTPGNIAGMAKIKELDAIAIADHNCAKNLRAADAVCRAYGVVLVPAMEITTREEAHLLGYFETVEQAEGMSDWLYERLPDIMNVPEIFGAQQILNEDDVEIGTVDKLLLSAVDASIEELVEEIHRRGGAAVPAHINRGSNGVLGALGFLPAAPFDALEVARSLPCPMDLSGWRVTHSSDAHQLETFLSAIFTCTPKKSPPAPCCTGSKGNSEARPFPTIFARFYLTKRRARDKLCFGL